MPVIIYRQDDGHLAVVHPTPEALELFGIELIAQKDVPYGKPYKIMNAADVPQDREARQAWAISDEELTDGVGAEWDVFGEAE